MRTFRYINKLIKEWLPTLTFIGVILPVFVSLAAYHLSEHNRSKSIAQSFTIESCSNLEHARIAQSGKSNDVFAINTEYGTRFYHDNWFEIIEMLNDSGKNPTDMTLVVSLMDRSNQLLSRSYGLPSDELAKTATIVEDIFDRIGFKLNGDDCFYNL